MKNDTCVYKYASYEKLAITDRPKIIENRRKQMLPVALNIPYIRKESKKLILQ